MSRLSALLLLLPLTAGAAGGAQDDYYARDIFRAIEEARKSTHHYDYSSALRYNRSTAQSIQIPRLLNQELSQTMIETPDSQISTTPASGNGDTSSLSPQTNAVQLPGAATTVSSDPSPVTVTVR